MKFQYCRLARLFVGLMFALSFFSSSLAQAGGLSWNAVRSTVAVRSLASNTNIHVAASSNGIWTSSNLSKWTKVSLPANAGATYQDVIWDGTQFIAVGCGIIASSDGTNWTVVYPADPSYSLVSVAHANGMYVVVGTDGTFILRSTDSKSWTKESSGLTASGGTTYSLSGVGSNGSDFVASGVATTTDSTGGYSQADVVLFSQDGINWQLDTIPGGFDQNNDASNNVAYGAGLYVTGGYQGTYTSGDGKTWNQNNLTNFATDSTAPIWYMFRIKWVQDHFLATGLNFPSSGVPYESVVASPDGLNWTSHNIAQRGASVFNLNAIDYSAGQYVVGGYQGIYTSTDTATWKQVFTGPQTFLPECLIQGGKYVIPGGSGGLTSSDGTTWPDQIPNTASSGIDSGIGCGVYGNGIYVSIDNNQSINASTDGTTWTYVTSKSGLAGVTYDGSKFVVVGVDTATGTPYVLTSTNGTSWSAQASSGLPTSANFVVDYVHAGGLAFLNGKYVVWGQTGSGPFIALSSDGKTWTSVTSGLPSTETIESVAYGNGKYAAIGQDSSYKSVVATSSDGKTWNQISNVAGGKSAVWNALIWGNGEFMAAGVDKSTSQAAFLTSSDGISWSYSTTGETSEIYDVIWDGKRYLAVSYYDVLQAAPSVIVSSSSSSAGASSSGSTGSSGGTKSGGGGTIGLMGLTVLLLELRNKRRAA